MCNDLHSTYKAEFIREVEDVALEIAQEVAALDLNELPQEALDQEEDQSDVEHSTTKKSKSIK